MTYKPPVKDEIPGITSFLYEANRFREPHEYVGYWKQLEKIKIKAEKAGIKSLDIEYLVDSLIMLRDELESGAKGYRHLEDQNSELTEQCNQQYKSIKDLKGNVQNLQTQLKPTADKMIEYMHTSMDYGDHKEDCGWVELVSSGRVVDAKEEDYCTCGWVQRKAKLAADPQYKASRPQEVIVVKKRSGGSFKINLDIE